MENLTLRELVEKTKCRVGKYAGREAGEKFWRPFDPVCIKRNTINEGRDIASTFSLEIRHYHNGDMEVAVKFRDWMDSKFSREWDVSEILNLTNAEDVAHKLRKGVLYSEANYGEHVYWLPVDNDGWENLSEELESLGLPEENEERGPDEKIVA